MKNRIFKLKKLKKTTKSIIITKNQKDNKITKEKTI